MKAKLWYKQRNVVLLLAVVGFIIFEQSAIQVVLLDAFRPVIRFGAYMGRTVADVQDVFLHSGRRAEEVRELRIKNQALEARSALRFIVEQENKILRAAMGRETEELQFIYARMIGVSSSPADDFLIIDSGTRDGVQVGMTVLAAEGTVRIGTVDSTAFATAVIRPLSHAGEKINVYAPESGISSVAVGKGGGILEIQVPASIPLRRGEPLFSAAPPDFLIGYIEQIEKSDAGPFQIARTSHPVALTDIRRVFIPLEIIPRVNF